MASNRTTKLVVISSLLVFLCLNCYAEPTLDYIKTEYGFNSACQIYTATSDLDLLFLEKPEITSTKVIYGSLRSCSWLIEKTDTITYQIPNEKTTCTDSYNNISKNTTSSCTTDKLIPIEATKEIISYTPDFTKEPVKTEEKRTIKYCCQIEREYVSGRGYVIEIDVIPTFYSTIYDKFAWFNSSLKYKYDIINESTGLPTWLNRSAGFNGTNITTNSWIYDNTSQYFSDSTDYQIAINDSVSGYYETEAGGRNNSISYIYDKAGDTSYTKNDSYIAVLHFGFNKTNTFFNSKTGAQDAFKSSGDIVSDTGIIGKGGLYSGDDCVGIFTNATQYYYSALSVMLWVKPSSTTKWSTAAGDIFSSYSGSTLNWRILGYNNMDLLVHTPLDNDVSALKTMSDQFYLITVTCDQAYCYLYVNDTFMNKTQTNAAATSLINARVGCRNFGGTDGEFFDDGYIDEVTFLSKNLSLSEISYIVNSTLKGANYMYGPLEYKPNITLTFIAQTPNNLTTTSLFTGRVNISYSINSTDGIDNSSVKLFYKTNSTTTDCLMLINGTQNCGYRNMSYDNVTSDNYTWSLGDSKVYPYTENLDFQTYFRNIEHTPDTLTNQNQFISIELINISTTKQYGYYEIDLNSTTDTILPAYYCNSSYNFASNPTTSTSCTAFGTILHSNTLNHTHNTSVTNASRHHVLPFSINTSTQTIGNIKVTEKGYFIIRGQTGQTINLWKTDNISRTDAIKKSTNQGSSWANQTYTIDSHLHQFSLNDTFYYYSCANTTTQADLTCTETTSDKLELDSISPTAPDVYSPIENSTYLTDAIIEINYTESTSPNNYSIYYNISLYSSVYAYISQITANNSQNLNYSWNNTGTANGNYTIGVGSCDYQSNCGIGFSDVFEITRATTTTTTTTAAATTTTYPDAAAGLHPIEERWVIMIPCFALILSLGGFYFTKNPVPSIMATITWFASSLWTTNIRNIFDFTTGLRPYWISPGNWEVGTLYIVLAMIMGLWSLLIIVERAASVGWLGGKKDGE